MVNKNNIFYVGYMVLYCTMLYNDNILYYMQIIIKNSLIYYAVTFDQRLLLLRRFSYVM